MCMTIVYYSNLYLYSSVRVICFLCENDYENYFCHTAECSLQRKISVRSICVKMESTMSALRGIFKSHMCSVGLVTGS